MPLTAKEGEFGINFRRKPHIWIWRPFCFYANKVCIAHWGIVNNELSYFKGGLAYGHKHKVSFLLQVNSNHNSNMI